MIRNLLGALAFTACFAFAQSAAALVIQAKLTGFESTPMTVSGVGTGGGRGTFELLGADGPIPVGFEDILDASFQAVCLEPDSFVTVNQTYNFAVTDLAFAPTSAASTGGMGAAREQFFEGLVSLGGFESVEALTGSQVFSATGMVYELGYETLGNTPDLLAGDTLISGPGTLAGQTLVTQYLGGARGALEVDALALINLGPVGPSTFSVFEGQDFVVWNSRTVPTPGALALMGLGMIGLVAVRKRAG